MSPTSYSLGRLNQRSTQKGAPPRILGYGVGRRSLEGVGAAASVLRGRGYRVRVFEPGAHTLREQIRAFHASKGVIGIVGAELANILWMTPGSKVIVVKPLTMDWPMLSPILARILDLEYVSMSPEPDGMHPRLDPTAVEPYLTR